jgi:hypothetical protein
MLKVKDHPDLRRDTSNNALINHNTDTYYAALARKRRNKRENREINSLRTEVNELKELIKSLINTNNNER